MLKLYGQNLQNLVESRESLLRDSLEEDRADAALNFELLVLEIGGFLLISSLFGYFLNNYEKFRGLRCEKFFY